MDVPPVTPWLSIFVSLSTFIWAFPFRHRWGKSHKGRELTGLEIYGGTVDEYNRPAFKFTGNIHGDEPSGRQLLTALGEHLCAAYLRGEPAVVKMLKTVSILLIPSMNPDGFDARTRENRCVTGVTMAHYRYTKGLALEGFQVCKLSP